MDINIYVNQKKINPLCQKAAGEYIKRLSPFCRLKIIAKASKPPYTDGHNTKSYIINSQCDSTISSEQYARLINDIGTNGTSKLNYYIGYSDDELPFCPTLSLCTMDLSFEMSSVLLSEQIYRAYTILNNITYHK